MSSSLAAPRTVACEAPLAVASARQVYWRGLPFDSPGELPKAGIKPVSPSWQVDSLPRSSLEGGMDYGGVIQHLCSSLHILKDFHIYFLIFILT